MFGLENPRINDPYNTMNLRTSDLTEIWTTPVADKDGRATAKELRKLVTANPRLSYRDMRDLLMEYGADGPAASDLAGNQPGQPGAR